MWQDLVLAAMQGVFIGALIPTMLHANKKSTLSTALLITAGVSISSFVYFTLAFWGSAIATCIHAIQWGTLAYQRFWIDRVENSTN